MRSLPLIAAAAATTALSVFFAGTPLAYADITFTLGNHPQGGEQNILFGASESGSSITGFTNQTSTGFTFTSPTGQTLFQNAKGQALIQSNNGPVSQSALTSMQLQPSQSGIGYTDLIFNPLNGAPGTDATVTAIDNNGQSFSYDLGQGNNYLTLVASNKEVMERVSITLNSGGSFEQFKQPRVSGVCNIPPPGASSTTVGDCSTGGGGGGGGGVPEPATFMILGAGLVGLGAAKWRRRQS